MVRRLDYLIGYSSRKLKKALRKGKRCLREGAKRAFLLFLPMLGCLGISRTMISLRGRALKSDVDWFKSALHILDSYEVANDRIRIDSYRRHRDIPIGASSRTKKQLLFEVTVTADSDLRTGIQRVVRAQLHELLRKMPQGYEVEPVYLVNDGMRSYFRYARRIRNKIIGRQELEEGGEVTPSPGDVFYCGELNRGSVIQAYRNGVYRDLRKAGVSVNFLIHDLLPITRPKFFEKKAGADHAKWMKAIVKSSDRLICVSRAVRDDVIAWMAEHYPVGLKAVSIEVVHHGADIIASMPSKGFDRRAVDSLARIGLRMTFLMVGTMEPRKGYSQTLRAFERLWKKGLDINLVIVGKEGWDMEAVVSSIISNTENDRRLFWLTDISDEFLEKLYSMSACLIAASEGEGFGLPLIEAAQHDLPIIARDIPVFREVADGSVFFFSGLRPIDLAAAVEEWIKLFQSGAYPKSNTMRWLTWEESVDKLAGILTGEPGISEADCRSWVQNDLHVQ
jgi:glycosyltransferase involved in cell wall biosynthesis